MHIHITINNQYRYFTCNSYEKLLKIFETFYKLTGDNRIKVINKNTSFTNGKTQLTHILYTNLGMREEVL